jgi:aldehyde:ferredoxin oxidoreductase
MTTGFFGRILCVDLSHGRITQEALPEQLYRQVLGGQGLGVRLLHDCIPRGADPLGLPDRTSDGKGTCACASTTTPTPT